jgi:nucleotide-binding universal stress UspA family protein
MTSHVTTNQPPTQMSKLERILVPVDFSNAGAEGLNYAIMLASRFAARITLIHVVEMYCGPSDPTYGYFPVDDGALVAASAKRLQEIAAERVPGELQETTLVRHGVPFHQICTVAKETKMDLIVIATHGRTGMAHVLMGSTAERIVRHAPCAVLTVRRSASDAATGQVMRTSQTGQML